MTPVEKEFLDLPSSQLALKLDALRMAQAKGQRWYWRLWSGRKHVLALSAVLIALGPLYEVNHWAYDRWTRHRRANETLRTARSLISLRATDSAEAEILKAVLLEPTNPEVEALQARLELEKLLTAGREDRRSLGIIERRFKDPLADDETCAYLFAMAYLDADTDKAANWFAHALEIKPGDPVNQVRVKSGVIALRSREFERSGDGSKLDDADKIFLEAEDARKLCPADMRAALAVSLYNARAMIQLKRSKVVEAVETTTQQCKYANETGDVVLIAKSTAALADKLEKAGRLEEAWGYGLLAIQQLSAANDDRGLYRARFTVARIERGLSKLMKAREDAEFALQKSTVNGDSRIRNSVLFELAKIELLAGNQQSVDQYTKMLKAAAQFAPGGEDDWDAQTARALLDGVAAGWQGRTKTAAAFHLLAGASHQAAMGGGASDLCQEIERRFSEDEPWTQLGARVSPLCDLSFVDQYFALFRPRPQSGPSPTT